MKSFYTAIPTKTKHTYKQIYNEHLAIVKDCNVWMEKKRVSRNGIQAQSR